MAALDGSVSIVKYNHGGTLVREGEVRYDNGKVVEFIVDPDKLCYWDLIGDLKELGYDIKKTVNLFFTDGEGTLKPICDDKGVMGLVEQLRRHCTVDIYVEFSDVNHEKSMPDALLFDSKNDVELDLGKDNERDCSRDSDEDDEERLVDAQIINYISDDDEEREHARDKVNEYIQLRKTIEENVDDSDNENGDEGRAIDGRDIDTRNTDIAHVNETGKVVGYESDYFDSSDPGSYVDTSGGSDADDAVRHKSSKKFFDPSIPMDDFKLDLKFKDLKMFKNQLVEFSTRKGFEFKYVKNDALRVRARCSAKDCMWLILCSWCSGKKMYVVKHYVPTHSCMLGTTRNKRVTARIIAKKFGDMISAMPFIKPRHLKAMVRRELGVFITDKVCRNAKRLATRRNRSLVVTKNQNGESCQGSTIEEVADFPTQQNRTSDVLTARAQP